MTTHEFNSENEPTPELAAALGSLTSAEGTTEIWQSALSTARPVRTKARRIASAGVQVVVVLLILTVVIGIMLPPMGKARSSVRYANGDMPPVAASPSSAQREMLGRVVEETQRAKDTGVTAGTYGYAPSEQSKSYLKKASAGAVQEKEPVQAADRQVIRKANIDLKARDVRATFLKAAQVLSEANGEYIEQSSLTGQDENLQASLTLRVSASRLSEVLNQLRGLATVVSESSGGEDVTNQVVDLEARLRNEQRVETELLGLMESRKDAPLRDVLELRDSISRVRENIERMTAQRERLGRLVSLATVLVIINPDTTKPAPLPDGLGHYFLKQVRAAWQSSMELLADSIAFLIRLIIGGAFFWLLAILIVVAVLALRRRALRAGAAEPAPRLG
jgi:hypothetical protein